MDELYFFTFVVPALVVVGMFLGAAWLRRH